MNPFLNEKLNVESNDLRTYKMTQMVFANEDLKRLIFSFGDVGHREFTKSLTKILKVDAQRFHDKYYEDRNDRCIMIT